jgi:dipeptidase
MCDTIVALGSATQDGATLFGKNSDREPDEVQNIVIIPRRQYKPGDSVKCTYISIPQVEETCRVLLSQPFWMFGAEMGANEHGVMIGNEAIFTREKPDKSGLTGMDLLRLALERSRSARQALDTIIGLLERHGQGGNCGYRSPFYYMNTFLIADAKEAYVLETVKSWWAWKKVHDTWSISNVASLEADIDGYSPALIENAVRKGYCKSESTFNFRKCYSDRVITWGAAGKPREACSRGLLLKKKGGLATADIMAILRDHGGRGGEFRPDKHGGTVCMHAADKLIRRSQSVASLVGKVSDKEQFFYMTGSSQPCLSPFFPVFGTSTATPAGYLEGGAAFDGETYWWECEKLHRQVLRRFPAAFKDIKPYIAEYEQAMLDSLERKHAAVNQAIIDEYFLKARGIVRGWGQRLDNLPEAVPGLLYRSYWNGYNKLDGIS